MTHTNCDTQIGANKNTPNKLLPITVAVFMLLFSSKSLLADTSFGGTLKNVSISDSAGLNKPPTASFTYSQEGDIFTFDASESSDPDGNITEYRWDFGDGSIGSGLKIDHHLATQDSPITLTVVDNSGGLALTQIIVKPNDWVIEDDFATLTPWTSIGNSSAMIVSDNKATVSNTWSTSAQEYTAKALLSIDQTAQVIVELETTTNKGGVVLRYDPTGGTYYNCYIKADKAYINYFNGSKIEYLASTSGLSFSTNLPLNVSCTAIGDTITLFVNGNEYVKDIHTGTTANGRYVGAYVGNNGSKAYISQFKAKSE